jgi:hypothetical protein
MRITEAYGRKNELIGWRFLLPVRLRSTRYEREHCGKLVFEANTDFCEPMLPGLAPLDVLPNLNLLPC